MSHEAATWLNRIGIILGFFSFWFAAPEFIGEERLKSWEQILAQTTKKLPYGVVGLYFVTGGLLVLLSIFGILGSYWKFISNNEPEVFKSVRFQAFLMTLAFLIIFFGRPFVKWLKGISLKFVTLLANDRNVRQRSLFLGAFLFILSTALEFIATFESTK